MIRLRTISLLVFLLLVSARAGAESSGAPLDPPPPTAPVVTDVAKHDYIGLALQFSPLLGYFDPITERNKMLFAWPGLAFFYERDVSKHLRLGVSANSVIGTSKSWSDSSSDHYLPYTVNLDFTLRVHQNAQKVDPYLLFAVGPGYNAASQIACAHIKAVGGLLISPAPEQPFALSVETGVELSQDFLTFVFWTTSVGFVYRF